MTRRLFKEEMLIHMGKLKEIFFAEFWSDYSCLTKSEEQKIQNSIRKIMNVLNGMDEGSEGE